MRAAGKVSAVVVSAVALLASCGGSDVPGTVNGCDIEPATACAGADLSGADLSGADLSGATLTGANLEDADLRGTDLVGADLTDARLVDADLSGADLTRANLTGATITGTNLDGATLCGTIRTNGTTDDTSCPASPETTGAETAGTATITATEPAIVSFEIGDLSCGHGVAAPVTVSWKTENATAVEIAVDGSSPTGYGPDGSTELYVACTGVPHRVSITPQSDSGPGMTRSEDVSPG